ncbi:hypothetical protein L7F22_021625 [Adiantum nelumboides]|nr:hypothetical protein [Adiantum nelumboides]
MMGGNSLEGSLLRVGAAAEPSRVACSKAMVCLQRRGCCTLNKGRRFLRGRGDRQRELQQQDEQREAEQEYQEDRGVHVDNLEEASEPSTEDLEDIE